VLRIAFALTGIVLLAFPVAAETTDRTVKANTRTGIGGFLGYEVDTCYGSVIPAVKVRQAPSNGSIEIIPHEQALGKETRCPGRKVRGLAYVYTPKKGFKGSDELSIDVPWASTDSGPETLMTYTFRIRVE
jgi:hypothetical protein